MRVAQQAVVLPALTPPRAFFSFQHSIAAIQAVSADGLAALVHGVRRLGALAGLEWRRGLVQVIVERDI